MVLREIISSGVNGITSIQNEAILCCQLIEGGGRLNKIYNDVMSYK